MWHNAQLLALAEAVTPLAARQYAESRGWRLNPKGYELGLYLFQHPSESLRQLQIPIRGSGSDYGEAILDAGERLAQSEGRTVLPVINDMFFVGADLVRYRVLSPQTQTGTVSLEGGLSLLQGARQSLLASACSVKNPVGVHPRMSWDEAKQMVRQTRLGQTEHNSFTVKIACPVEAVGGVQLLHAGEPFVRQATHLLMESASRLVGAIERNELDRLGSAAGSAIPISANLCDAFAEMHMADESAEVEISIQWSGVIAPASGIPQTVNFRPEYFPQIEALGQRLRAKPEPSIDTFVGTVEELRGEIDEHGRRAGEVILGIMREGKIVSVRVMLDAEAHARADQAYMAGGTVKLKGTFRQGGRVHEIAEAADFSLVK